MGQQIHRRIPVGFVEDVLEAFNRQQITEKKACELLGIKRARLYRLRRQWLRCRLRGEGFLLWSRKNSEFHRFPE